MRNFHISDVLSVTTGRLVSCRHMEGIYDFLNFLTGDNLFTHQLPRAGRETEPWLRTQFPQLFPDQPLIALALTRLDELMEDGDTREDRAAKITKWVEELRTVLELPEQIPVYEMDEEMHTHIDPVEELGAMIGDQKVIKVQL